MEIISQKRQKKRERRRAVTKKQRKEVRRALRRTTGAASGRRCWTGCGTTMPGRTLPAGSFCGCATWRACGNEDVIRALYIGRTTYYSKELEALSTVGIYAAAAGLLDAE